MSVILWALPTSLHPIWTKHVLRFCLPVTHHPCTIQMAGSGEIVARDYFCTTAEIWLKIHDRLDISNIYALFSDKHLKHPLKRILSCHPLSNPTANVKGEDTEPIPSVVYVVLAHHTDTLQKLKRWLNIHNCSMYGVRRLHLTPIRYFRIIPELWTLLFLEELRIIGASNVILPPSGSIPTAIGNFRHLRKLCVISAGLTGNIPAALGQCSQLRCIDLFDNQLTGKIPSELQSCTKLQFLDLRHNDHINTDDVPFFPDDCSVNWGRSPTNW